MAPKSTIAYIKETLGATQAEGLVYAQCGESERDLEGWAQDLYACLRAFDDVETVQVIVAQGLEGEGLADAIMNRLKKAAGGRQDLDPSK
jgi:hypothetical protein